MHVDYWDVFKLFQIMQWFMVHIEKKFRRPIWDLCCPPPSPLDQPLWDQVTIKKLETEDLDRPTACQIWLKFMNQFLKEWICGINTHFPYCSLKDLFKFANNLFWQNFSVKIKKKSRFKDGELSQKLDPIYTKSDCI